MEHKMFCYQCQETAGCSGCTQMGVCGKKPEVAAMQDLLVYVSKGLSAVTTQLRKEGTKVSEETNHLITWNLFTTITNANFDNEAIIARIHNTLSVRRTLILQVKDTSGLPEAAFWDIKTKDGSDASDDVLFVNIHDTQSYFEENMRLLQEENLNALFSPNQIYTKIRDDNPTRYINGSKAKNVMVADGCVIEGEVENSVLFRGVHVGKGAKVKNCVLMQDTVVEDNASVEYVITDKNVRVTEGKSLTGNESYQVYVSKGQVV